MKTKMSEILSDPESVMPAETLLFAQKNPAIRILKDQIEELLRQLRIVEKAGAIDDIADREGPALCASIEVKSKELFQLLAYEKTKDKRREFYKVNASEFEIKGQVVEQVPQIPNASNNILLARQTAKAIDQKINVMAKLNRSYADSNLHVVGAVGAILIAIQLVFNLTFENRLKSTARETVVQNLENRLKEAEDKNYQLSQSMSNLHREIAFQRTMNLKMPQLSAAKKQSYTLSKKLNTARTVKYGKAVKPVKRTAKKSNRYISSQSNYGRR